MPGRVIRYRPRSLFTARNAVRAAGVLYRNPTARAFASKSYQYLRNKIKREPGTSGYRGRKRWRYHRSGYYSRFLHSMKLHENKVTTHIYRAAFRKTLDEISGMSPLVRINMADPRRPAGAGNTAANIPENWDLTSTGFVFMGKQYKNFRVLGAKAVVTLRPAGTINDTNQVAKPTLYTIPLRAGGILSESTAVSDEFTQWNHAALRNEGVKRFTYSLHDPLKVLSLVVKYSPAKWAGLKKGETPQGDEYVGDLTHSPTETPYALFWCQIEDMLTEPPQGNWLVSVKVMYKVRWIDFTQLDEDMFQQVIPVPD